MSEIGSDPDPKWSGTVPLVAGSLALAGLILVAGYWGAEARVSGTIFAPGVIVSEAEPAIVRSKAGGTLRRVLVETEDDLQAGDLLVLLEDLKTRDAFDQVNRQLHEVSVQRARLMAEQEDLDTIVFDPRLLDAGSQDAALQDKIDSVQRLFSSQRKSLLKEEELLTTQTEQIGKQIDALQIQADAIRVRLDLLLSETTDSRSLEVPDAQTGDLTRDALLLRERLGGIEAEIARMKGRAARTGIDLLHLRATRRDAAVSGLADLKAREAQLMQHKATLRDTIAQLEIRAPGAGRVIDLHVTAAQSTLRPGQELMTILPSDQLSLVSARIEARNRPQIFAGQEATVRLAGQGPEAPLDIPGQIETISAETARDPMTGLDYFDIAIRVPPDALTAAEIARSEPKQPVEVFIETPGKSPMAYLVEPVMSFAHGQFRQ